MSKKFKDLMEEQSGLVPNMIHPAEIRVLKKFAHQMSSSFQSTMDNVIEKIETRLNHFGYSLGGDFDGETEWSKEGEDEYFILDTQGNIIKNLIVRLSWEKLSSGQQYHLRPEGSELRYDVTLHFIEVGAAEMAELIHNTFDLNDESVIGEHADTIDENTSHDHLKKIIKNMQANLSSVPPERRKDILHNIEAAKGRLRKLGGKMDEETLEEGTVRVKKVDKALTVFVDKDNEINFTVNGDGSLHLNGVEIPKAKSLEVMNAIMDHYVSLTQK